MAVRVELVASLAALAEAGWIEVRRRKDDRLAVRRLAPAEPVVRGVVDPATGAWVVRGEEPVDQRGDGYFRLCRALGLDLGSATSAVVIRRGAPTVQGRAVDP